MQTEAPRHYTRGIFSTGNRIIGQHLYKGRLTNRQTASGSVEPDTEILRVSELIECADILLVLFCGQQIIILRCVIVTQGIDVGFIAGIVY